MEEYTLYIAIASAIIAAISAFLSFLNNRQAKENYILADKTNKQAIANNEKSSKIAEGAIEIEISTSISQAKLHVQSTMLEHKKILGGDELQIFCEKAIESAIENYLNQYDLACQKYLDGKLDKDRFEKSYKDILRSIFYSENYRHIYEKDPLAYEATEKVVKKLHSKE